MNPRLCRWLSVLLLGGSLHGISLQARTPTEQARVEALTDQTTDFQQAEPFEALSGGAATSRQSVNEHSFSHHSANLTLAQEMDFKLGNAVFRKFWVTAPASTTSSDGLGPLYNARSCQGCHLKDGRGHPPQPGEQAASFILRLGISPPDAETETLRQTKRLKVVPDPTYGTQLQTRAVPGLTAEGQLELAYTEFSVRFADGFPVSLRKPYYSVVGWNQGAPAPTLQLSPRVASPMIGLGLLEMIEEEDLLRHADPEDRNGDGISGRPNWVWDLERQEVALGRFGWKAGEPSIRQQTASAFAGDIGIGNTLFPAPHGDCTNAQRACRQLLNGNNEQGVEVSEDLLRLVTFYSRNLAVPARRQPSNPEVLRGKQLFYQLGCPACHVPKYVTRRDPSRPEQSFQLIWPYTDLLLHDLGAGLADALAEGEASGREWRTAPLWGLGLTEVVSGHTQLLHDGRARNVWEAILWHGGEAEPTRQRVLQLNAPEREQLLRFLQSL